MFLLMINLAFLIVLIFVFNRKNIFSNYIHIKIGINGLDIEIKNKEKNATPPK